MCHTVWSGRPHVRLSRTLNGTPARGGGGGAAGAGAGGAGGRATVPAAAPPGGDAEPWRWGPSLPVCGGGVRACRVEHAAGHEVEEHHRQRLAPLDNLAHADQARPPHADVAADVQPDLERPAVERGEADAAEGDAPEEGEQSDGVDGLVGEEDAQEGGVRAVATHRERAGV